MKNNKAFTLIELMIVIAIIAIIAAIAIPGILSARKSANASSAFANLKSFCTAMTVYQNEDREQKYPPSTAEFGRYFNHLDIKSGYKYEYATVDTSDGEGSFSQYVYFAYPTSANNGKKVYVVDESTRIWEYTSSDADEDKVLGGSVTNASEGIVDACWEVPGPERITWTQGGTGITPAFVQKT